MLLFEIYEANANFIQQVYKEAKKPSSATVSSTNTVQKYVNLNALLKIRSDLK